MYTLIAFATQWGSRYGGINSFNTDFLTAFGTAYHLKARVVCIVTSASQQERDEAWNNARIKLVPLLYEPQNTWFTKKLTHSGIKELKQHDIKLEPEQTIWLGHDLVSGEAAIEAVKLVGGRSALIHHMSYDHYESYAEDSETAYTKKQSQEDLFQQADFVFAVGPVLRDALYDRLHPQKPVHMLIPGLAEISPRPAPKTFSAFLSGRLSKEAAKIKQGYLGVAAFAKAHKKARDNGMPEGLCRQPKLLLRGIDFEALSAHEPGSVQINSEHELKKFAEQYAEAVLNIQALPYIQDRQRLYADLSGTSVALMPSWHEGFGLVAWEAIAAGVPLIISENSGVYRLLEEEFPGAGPGCVYSVDIRGAVSEPYFHEKDLNAATDSLTKIAKEPEQARRQAATLRDLLSKYTWPACTEQMVNIFQWPIEKGSISEQLTLQTEQITPTVTSKEQIVGEPILDSPLHMPQKRWQAGSGMAISQLLRAEEAQVPFDSARLTELALENWLDDARWPLAVRLVIGAGGLGKTRLAMELCIRRLEAGWHAGFLDTDLDNKGLAAGWQIVQGINKDKPLLIVIDYAETRQAALLFLLKLILQTSPPQPIRVLLLARDGGEWWDNLEGKDRDCESLLSGHATSGPYRLSPLHISHQEREAAYQQALKSFAAALQIPEANIPAVSPEFTGEHFDRPLYLQMAALLALHGEQPLTAEGLTKALLNHERRYWCALLSDSAIADPERYAQQLLALTTLAGGFSFSKEAKPYWDIAEEKVLTAAQFTTLFNNLIPLYPGRQGLQEVRPDLLGEALVAQSLSRPTAALLLDAVLGKNTAQPVRRNALTILARLSSQYSSLEETLIAAMEGHFSHCCQNIIEVCVETAGDLPRLAEAAFERLQPAAKSQIAGMLDNFLPEQSVQLARLNCTVRAYLVKKAKQKLRTRKKDKTLIEHYAGMLINYSRSLRNVGNHDEALVNVLESRRFFEKLNKMNPKRYVSNYALSLHNCATMLGEVGQCSEALKKNKEALEIRRRLAEKNPDRYEPDYAVSLNNYANLLMENGQSSEAFEKDKEALEIHRRLVEKNPERYEPDYAVSLDNYANRLSGVGQSSEALEKSKEALEIHRRLAEKYPDRYEPDYAVSLNNYANRLMENGQSSEAFEKDKEALEIHRRLVEKNPERYEPDYAVSLNNYAYRLSGVGQSSEALEKSKEALEIHRRLAEKYPDRYEPDYAVSLNNYAYRLMEIGQSSEAVEKSKEALEIYRRLAENYPDRFKKNRFSSQCFHHFLEWLCDPTIAGNLPEELNRLPQDIPSHRRPLLELYAAFVQGCRTQDHSIRAASFQRVLNLLQELTVADKTISQDYWLCASAWCATHTPEVTVEIEWLAVFQQYRDQRQGNLPAWMPEVARRLSFQWPE